VHDGKSLLQHIFVTARAQLTFPLSSKAALEVAYQLRDRAKFVTFSEELMWGTIVYLGWGRLIWQNFMKDAEQMAHLIAEIYRFYTNQWYMEQNIKNAFTISVADLGQIDEVHMQVNLMAQNLIVDMDDIKDRDYKGDNLQVKWANEILPVIHDFNDAVCASSQNHVKESKPASNSPFLSISPLCRISSIFGILQ
jgi:Clostripain family